VRPALQLSFLLPTSKSAANGKIDVYLPTRHFMPNMYCTL
jgi:hypothetical protein